ncbi:peptidoglycan-binding domain-containing protein [Tritonibacter multivorans]|uniref:peptidoglycan-binding domain-containing protein n=1 Tax=Tritonibacter multivorans TaxID=928856 RepID=UPI002E25C7C3
MTTAANPVAADNLGAALLGGIVGGVIVNEANKNKQKKRTVVRSSNYSAARAANRETQTSLNYFGFNAGTPDGVFGSRSRAAASQYQAYMGFPATGRLTQYERDFLVSSYNRALVGGPQVIKAMQSPNGVRNVLIVWRDEAMGGGGASGHGGYGYAGLPVEVSDAVDEIAASAEPTAEQLLQRSGFISLADMNGDGRNDYMIDTSVSGSSFWCGASQCSVMVFASTPGGYQRNDFLARGVTVADFSCHQGTCRLNQQPQTQLAATPAQPAAPAPQPQQEATVLTNTAPQPEQGLGGLQLFQAPTPATQTASLTSHCSKVSLLTSSNGGYVTAATMTDPELALGEQFCLARSYAINKGETLVSNLSGVTPAQVDAQCDQFGPAVQPYLAKLPTRSSAALIAEVQKFILSSNMSLEQLEVTAGICLYSGYRRDNMDVALGAALTMSGLGKRPYAELVGHHLALGFGVAPMVSQAQDWYSTALTALDGGAEPVFAPGQPERIALLKAAAAGLGGQTLAQPVPAAAEGTGLPSFSLGD